MTRCSVAASAATRWCGCRTTWCGGVGPGPGAPATPPPLPQGDYQIDVRAGGAIVSAGSFRLSRTKTVNLTAVTSPDLATVGGGLLLAGGGLPLLPTTRRRRLLDHLRSGRPDRPDRPDRPNRPKWCPR